jgi:hypothetical protein
MTGIKYRTVDVDGFKIFYREAGPACDCLQYWRSVAGQHLAHPMRVATAEQRKPWDVPLMCRDLHGCNPR